MIEFLLALAVALILIYKAGDVFVDSACRIARALGVSTAVIALTFVAFGTSAPEFFTSIIAALQGNVGIAYGNVVGSNIVNITPILALAAIFGVAIIGREQFNEGLIMLFTGAALVLMALNGTIGFVGGLILLAMFAFFLRFLFKRETSKDRRQITVERGEFWYSFLIFTIGLLGVILGSYLLVYSGVGIAKLMGVPEAAIGFTLVAIGTSIPELATILVSISKKLYEVSVGTIVGSCIFNTTFIIGWAALLRPLTIDSQALLFSNPMMLVIMALLVGLMWGRQRLTRGHGLALLLFYVFYLVGLGFFYGG